MTEPATHQGPQRKEDFLQDVAKLADYVAGIQSKLNDNTRRYWKRLLGERLDEMLSSRETTGRLMTDANPRIREGVFSVEALHWKPQSRNEEKYRLAISSDPDDVVRATALPCLCRLYRGSADRELSSTLARIIKEESNCLAFRRAAYLGLFEVQGIEIPTEFIGVLYRTKNGLPNDLDWSMVKSFLTE